MEWINPKDKLPENYLVVLGLGFRIDSGCIGFQLCGLDPRSGWKDWPSLDDVEIHFWMPIKGPKGEHETLYLTAEEIENEKQSEMQAMQVNY